MRSLLISLMLICSYASAYDTPDVIYTAKASDPKHEMLVVEWHGKVFKLKVNGRVEDPNNYAVIERWILSLEDIR
jgi:hypothetical protein